MKETTKVLFVCLGNICRSTMAEAVLRHLVEQQGLSGQILVDSAGTGGYHIGEPPHRGTQKKLEAEGISWQGIRARKLTKSDLQEFDYLVGMDGDNLRGILRYANDDTREKASLLSSFVADAPWEDVPDPWYTGDFDETFRLVSEGCRALLERIQQ